MTRQAFDGRFASRPVMLVLALALMPPAARAQSHAVVTKVQAKSWIDGSTFDRDDFRTRCAEAGLELVEPGTPGAIGTAAISYVETKGPGFSMFGVGKPVGYGTNIQFKVTLLDARAKTLLNLTAESATPPGLEQDAFHRVSRELFFSSPGYTLSCAMMASALGSRAQMVKLLPWAVLDARPAALLKSAAFQGENDLERAYLAVAYRDYKRIEQIGAAAVEPLLLLFLNSAADRDQVGTFPATAEENAAVLVRAASVLATEDDERIPDVLNTFLNDYTESRVGGGPAVQAALVSAIRALGRLGTVFNLPLLEEWQKSDPAIASEAKKAVDLLRQRLIIP